MALAWSDTKAALDAALSSASNTDRPAVAARAFRMCSALCVGVNDVRDTELPDLAPWRSASAA